MKQAKDIFLSWNKLNDNIISTIDTWDYVDWTILKKNEKVYVEDIINLIKESQIDIIKDLEMLISNSEDDLDRGQGKYIVQSFIDECNKIL